MKFGLAALRVIVGSLFVGHGTQKLFGWFGGHGLEGTAGFFDQIGLSPGKRAATAAGASEAAGGALLALGLLTPAAQALLTGVMVQAIRTVHAPKGPWVTEGGWEYNAVLIASAFAITDVGPGDLSLDNALGLNLRGPLWAFGGLAAGVLGPELMLRSPEAKAPEQGFEAAEGQPATSQPAPAA